MFATTQDVLNLTDAEVTEKDVQMAQVIIESYVGRTEVEVEDTSDSMILARATAYQAAYINANWDTVFTQIRTTQISQVGQIISFSPSGNAPFIAPLAEIACKNLSWKRMRSIKTGGIFHDPTPQTTWVTD